MMSQIFRRVFLYGVVLLSSALVLAACGTDAPPEEVEPADTADAAAAVLAAVIVSQSCLL